MPKQALNKSQRLEIAKKEHEKWLASMGYKGGKSLRGKHGRRVGIYSLPNLRAGLSQMPFTSDRVAGNGTKKDSVKYTGDEIAGIVTTHKSNLMPIRKDNKQAAVDAASMRR